MRQRKRCTDPEDLELLIELYADFFLSVTRHVPRLSFAGLGWGADELASLSRFLPHCARCRRRALRAPRPPSTSASGTL